MSSSILTRSLFQRLSTGQSIQHTGCLTFRRFIFKFSLTSQFARPDTSGLNKSILKNLDLLQNASRFITRDFRGPPAEDLAKAWVAFFAVCKQKHKEVTGYQAKIALDVWSHLLKNSDPDSFKSLISPDDALTALSALELHIPTFNGFVFDSRDKDACYALTKALSEYILENDSTITGLDLIRDNVLARYKDSQFNLRQHVNTLSEVVHLLENTLNNPSFDIGNIGNCISQFSKIDLKNENPELVKKWMDVQLGWKMLQTLDTSQLSSITSSLKHLKIYPDGRSVKYIARGAFRKKLNKGEEIMKIKQDITNWAEANVEAEHSLELSLETLRASLNSQLLYWVIENWDDLMASGGDFDSYGSDITSIRNQIVAEFANKYLSEEEQEFLWSVINEFPVTERWDATAVSSLSQLYLSSQNYQPLHKLLKDSYPWYNFGERSLVVKAIVDYVLERPEGADKSLWADMQWNAYALLASFKVPLDRETLSRFLSAFLDAKTPEKAFEVFSHMRESPRPQGRPIEADYLIALHGFGDLGDVEVVRKIHNQFKLDTRVDPSVEIYNALILAYTKGDQAQYALRFWDTVLNSAQGPNAQSALYALTASELLASGTSDPRKIWDSIQQRDIMVNSDIFAKYIACLAHHGLIEEAQNRIESDVDKYDRVASLAHFVDAAPDHEKDNVLNWIQSKYSDDIEQILQYQRPEKTSVMNAQFNMYKKIFGDETWE